MVRCMCGRATLISPVEEIAEVFGVAPIPLGPPRYNVAPGQDLAIVRSAAEGGRELALVHWGLVPWWSKNGKIARSCIQARRETIAKAPAFRQAFESKRCLVVVDGFYEWSGIGKARQPHFLRLAGGGPFAIAGVWDSWKAPDGTRIETCAVVTRAARGPAADLHDRMPFILDGDTRERWLSAAPGEAAAELVKTDWIPELVILPVSKHVNDVKNDDPHCIAPHVPGSPPPSGRQTTLRFE